MDIKKLQSVVIGALEDVKAQDIRVFDTSHLTSLFDRITMASGTSNRQTKALAASVRDAVKEAGGHIINIEGEDTGEWVLVDIGDMVVHIMQPAIREYYRLEEIWGEKEVKIGAAKRTGSRVGATAESAEEKPRKTSRHLAASQALPEEDDAPKKPVRKTVRKTPAAAGVPTGGRVKVAASKSSVVKKAPTRAAPKTATKAKAPAKATSTAAGKTDAAAKPAKKPAAPRAKRST